MEKLKQGMKDLQNELKRIHDGDPKLLKLSSELDEAISGTGEVSRELYDAMKHTAKAFEARHPQLTALVNNVMNSLSNLGI